MSSNKGVKAASPRGEILVAADIGNGWVKAEWGSDVSQKLCIPAVIKKVPSYQELTPGENSAVVYSGGQKWAIGDCAKELNGRPLFEMGKAQFTPIILAAVLGFVAQEAGATFRIRLLVPDRAKDEWAELVDRIPTEVKDAEVEFKGYERFKLDPVISKVELFSEGEPIWQYVSQKGLIEGKHRSRQVGVVDAGTGDLSVCVFSSSGDLIRDYSFQENAMNQLSSSIGQAISAKYSTRQTPKRSEIMESIKDGTFTYEERGQVFDFKDIFNEISRDWAIELGTLIIKDRWADITRSIGAIFIVGGAAGVLEPIAKATNGRFRVLTIEGVEPQMVNAHCLRNI